MPLGLAVFGILMVYLPLAFNFILMGVLAILSGLSFLLPVDDDLARMSDTGSTSNHEASL